VYGLGVLIAVLQMTNSPFLTPKFVAAFSLLSTSTDLRDSMKYSIYHLAKGDLQQQRQSSSILVLVVMQRAQMAIQRDTA
jgi:hypothetical protein